MNTNDYNREIDIMPNPTERFIIKIDDIKQSMGLWYSLLIQRIIPALIFVIPINVILGRLYRFVQSFYAQDLKLSGTFLLVTWILVMIGFIAVTIFAPKAATAVEFVFGFCYLYLAFKHHLFNNLLGYSVLIATIIYLLLKLVFLIINLIKIKTFAKDGENIERDESGRIVRASNEEFFFVKQSEDEQEENEPVADDDFYFSTENKDSSEEENEPVADDDFFFAAENKETPEEENERLALVTDDDFCFTKIESDDGPVSTDDDFYFG